PRAGFFCVSPCPSEGLSDGNIDLEVCVAAPLVQRYCDVRAERPKAGVVAHAETGARAHLVERRLDVRTGSPRIDERDVAECVRCAVAKLGADFRERATAPDRPVGIAR